MGSALECSKDAERSALISTAHHESLGWWVNPGHFEPPRCDRNQSHRSQNGRGLFPMGHLKWIKQQQAGNAHPTDRLPQ